MKWEVFLSLLGCLVLLCALIAGIQAMRERVQPIAPALEGSSPP